MLCLVKKVEKGLENNKLHIESDQFSSRKNTNKKNLKLTGMIMKINNIISFFSSSIGFGNDYEYNNKGIIETSLVYILFNF